MDLPYSDCHFWFDWGYKSIHYVSHSQKHLLLSYRFQFNYKSVCLFFWSSISKYSAQFTTTILYIILELYFHGYNMDYICWPYVLWNFKKEAWFNGSFHWTCWIDECGKNNNNWLYSRRPVPSTDQALPSCFYFRISWILMERPWKHFFGSCGFLQGLRS